MYIHKCDDHDRGINAKLLVYKEIFLAPHRDAERSHC